MLSRHALTEHDIVRHQGPNKSPTQGRVKAPVPVPLGKPYLDHGTGFRHGLAATAAGPNGNLSPAAVEGGNADSIASDVVGCRAEMSMGRANTCFLEQEIPREPENCS